MTKGYHLAFASVIVAATTANFLSIRITQSSADATVGQLIMFLRMFGFFTTDSLSVSSSAVNNCLLKNNGISIS